MPNRLKVRPVLNDRGRQPEKTNITIYGSSKVQGPRSGLSLSSEIYSTQVGKMYPGRINFSTMRVIAGNSAVVRAILTLRAHQVAKLPYRITPKNDQEPPKQMHILEYSAYNIEHHPAYDDAEILFLIRILDKLDPKGLHGDKRELIDSADLSTQELTTIDILQKKHEDFYAKRNRDIRKIRKILDRPDPWFTQTKTWEGFVKRILNDLLILDRGAAIKLRDSETGELVGLMPVDGATIRPVIQEDGYIDPDQAYIQVVYGAPHQSYLHQDDVIIFMAYPVTDVRYFGYGYSPIETLYTLILSDLAIDKGNSDYYRKGGSIPEGFVSIEPPPAREGVINQIDQEQIEHMQRQLSAIMMGDYTQVPIVSGGKVTWIDFKGKRRDMQFKELAEYLARKICAVLQVSPQDIGMTQDINRATGTVQADMTRSKGLETLMRVVSEYITSEVIEELRPEGDLALSFEQDDLTRSTEEWKIDQQKLLAGVISINQYRATQGLPPVPWGHTPLQGTRNWLPEEEGAAPGGLPPLPGMAGGMPPGGVPPTGGMPPGAPPQGETLPTPENPGGLFGGDNPGAGMPAETSTTPPPIGQSVMKSTKFFELSKQEATPEYQKMIESFADTYKSSSNFEEYVELYDLHNYPGSEHLRSASDSYQHIASKLNVNIVNYVDMDRPVLFSRFDGSNVIVDGNGEEPITRSLSKAVVKALDEDTINELSSITVDLDEAVEMAIYRSTDPAIQAALREDFYKYKIPSVSDAEVEEVAACLGL